MSRAWPEVLWDEDFESWFYSGGASEYPRAQRASAKAEGFELVVARVIRDGRSHVATYEVAAVRVAGSIEPAPGPNEPPPQGVVVITAHDDWLLAWRRPEADTVNQAGADAMPPIDELVAEMRRRGVRPL